jgi:hypothetical protein
MRLEMGLDIVGVDVRLHSTVLAGSPEVTIP